MYYIAFRINCQGIFKYFPQMQGLYGELDMLHTPYRILHNKHIIDRFAKKLQNRLAFWGKI